MKKTTKTLLTLLGILAVLVFGYVALIMLYNGNTESGADADDGTQETTYVVDAESISSIKYSDGITEMSFQQKDDEWYYEADETIALDESLMESMAYEFQQIEAVRTIENPDALEDYGLEEPSYTVEITDAEGGVVILYIGNELDSYYYATTGDKEVVYTVSSSVVTAMEFDVENLREANELTED